MALPRLDDALASPASRRLASARIAQQRDRPDFYYELLEERSCGSEASRTNRTASLRVLTRPFS